MSVLVVVFVSLCTILTILIVVPIFVMYVIRNSIQATKYRQLVKLAGQIPKTGYSVVYKIGGKVVTVDVDGTTDSEAMKDIIKRGIRYDKIVSLTKL